MSRTINKSLKSEERLVLVKKAMEVDATIRQLKRQMVEPTTKDIAREYADRNLLCPLNKDDKCLIYPCRPLRCRSNGLITSAVDFTASAAILSNISRNVFFALTGEFPPAKDLIFSFAETISGKFVQGYFNYLMELSC